MSLPLASPLGDGSSWARLPYDVEGSQKGLPLTVCKLIWGSTGPWSLGRGSCISPWNLEAGETPCSLFFAQGPEARDLVQKSLSLSSCSLLGSLLWP